MCRACTYCLTFHDASMFDMNIVYGPTAANRDKPKAVCVVETIDFALVGLVIQFAICMALWTVDTAKAQTLDAPSSISLSLLDFFRNPVGAEGLVMNQRLLQAHGQQVRLIGYMVQQEKAKPGQFLLSPRPIMLSQHADGEADDLPPATVFVELAPAQRDSVVAYTRGVIEVVGELDLGRLEDADGRVSWVRLRLPSDSTRGMNGFEYQNYRHSMQHKH